MKNTLKKEAAKERYKALLRVARIPYRYAFDDRWLKAKPSFLKSTQAYNDGRYVRVKESEQRFWMEKLVEHPEDYFTKPYFMAVLGDFLPEGATRVALGLAALAVRKGLRVRAFHAAELRWNENNNALAKPTDPTTGTVIPYNFVVLHGIHTDDVQMRRQLTRDFLLNYKTAFRIIVLHGEDPLTHLHLKLGLNPTHIFHFPARLQMWKEEAVTI